MAGIELQSYKHHDNVSAIWVYAICKVHHTIWLGFGSGLWLGLGSEIYELCMHTQFRDFKIAQHVLQIVQIDKLQATITLRHNPVSFSNGHVDLPVDRVLGYQSHVSTRRHQLTYLTTKPQLTTVADDVQLYTYVQF